MKKPRRESALSVDGAISGLVVISFLQLLRMMLLRITILRIIRSGIRLTWALRATRCQPGNHICDFRVGHGSAGNVSAPVGRPQVRSARDHDCAQALIADQREK